MKRLDTALQGRQLEIEAIQAKTAPSNETTPALPSRFAQRLKGLTWKRLRGGLLFVVGYLLSPLCWWNDLVINLPIAYGFGYLCSLFSADWLTPGLISGYWISNVIGILLMQFGAVDALQRQPQGRNLKKDLFSGVVSSTIYTLLILTLIQFHILDVSGLGVEEGTLDLWARIPSSIAEFGLAHE